MSNYVNSVFWKGEPPARHQSAFQSRHHQRNNLDLLSFPFHLPYDSHETTMSSPPRYTDEPDLRPTPSKAYGTTLADTAATQPLLAAQASTNAQRAAEEGWRTNEDNDSDSYKLGVSVSDCDTEIRMLFVRKVYSILLIQLLATAGVSILLSLPSAKDFTHTNPWIMWIPMIGSFVSLFFVYWKRHHHPANLILLGLFTLFEATMIGLAVSYYESRIVSRQFSSFSSAH